MRSRFATITLASLLIWPLAAVGTPGGNLNASYQNVDLGVPAGSGTAVPAPPPIEAMGGQPVPPASPFQSSLTSLMDGENGANPPGSGSGPGSGPWSGSGTEPPAPPGEVNTNLFELTKSDFAGGTTASSDGADESDAPGTSGAGAGGDAGPTPGEEDAAGGGEGSGPTAVSDPEPTGPVVTYMILELRPDFLLRQSLRLFEAQTTSHSGQDSLGIAPALANNRRFVPLGEF